jgi:hypothetical protein
MADPMAEAMEDAVVPEPLQLTASLWPLTVTVLVPESYRVVYTALAPPVRVDPDAFGQNEGPPKSVGSPVLEVADSE